MKIEVAQLRTTPELHYFWMEAVQKCCSGHMLIHLPMQPESTYIALKCSFIQQNKWICYITSFGVIMVHNGEICRLTFSKDTMSGLIERFQRIYYNCTNVQLDQPVSQYIPVDLTSVSEMPSQWRSTRCTAHGFFACKVHNQ